MKKIYYLLLFVFLFTNSAICQKKTIYVNENLDEITESEYQKTEIKFMYLYSTIKSDTLIIKTKAKRDQRGLLSEALYHRIKNNINYISENKKISENDIIVINYYPGSDKCNESANSSFVFEKYSDYNQHINKLNNVKQFYIYKEIGNTKKYGKKLKWFQDPHGIFEKIFFKIHYPCGSYLIIFPDKTYVSYLGEYDFKGIFDEIQFKKKTDSIKPNH